MKPAVGTLHAHEKVVDALSRLDELGPAAALRAHNRERAHGRIVRQEMGEVRVSRSAAEAARRRFKLEQSLDCPYTLLAWEQ